MDKDKDGDELQRILSIVASMSSFLQRQFQRLLLPWRCFYVSLSSFARSVPFLLLHTESQFLLWPIITKSDDNGYCPMEQKMRIAHYTPSYSSFPCPTSNNQRRFEYTLLPPPHQLKLVCCNFVCKKKSVKLAYSLTAGTAAEAASMK